MKPSGVQLSRPIVPPGRQTRTSSSAAGWWCGANMTPRQDSTVSNSPSANGSASASASSHSSSAPRRAASCRPASNSSGVRSLATTFAPAQRGRDGGVARPGGDVEHPLARADATGVDEPRAQLGDQICGQGRVVTEGPHAPGAWSSERDRPRSRRWSESCQLLLLWCGEGTDARDAAFAQRSVPTERVQEVRRTPERHHGNVSGPFDQRSAFASRLKRAERPRKRCGNAAFLASSARCSTRPGRDDRDKGAP